MATGSKPSNSVILRIVQRMIASALNDYRPNLSKALGVLPGDTLPVTGPTNGGETGGGYPPKPATETVVGGVSLTGDFGGTAEEPTVVGVTASPQPMYSASESSVSYSLKEDSEIVRVTQRVKPLAPNDGSNYWEAHITTGDVELASWTSVALIDAAWNTVDTTVFNRTELDPDIDGNVIVFFTAVGAPGELIFEAPIIKLREI
jgi:hypothetical protein